MAWYLMVLVLWDPDAFKIATPKVDHNVYKGNNWEGLDLDDTVLNVKDTKIFAETVIAETAIIDAISENSVSSSQCSDLKQEKFKSNLQHTEKVKNLKQHIDCNFACIHTFDTEAHKLY